MGVEWRRDARSSEIPGGMDESLRLGPGVGVAIEADGVGTDGKPIGFSSVKGRFRRTAALS